MRLWDGDSTPSSPYGAGEEPHFLSEIRSMRGRWQRQEEDKRVLREVGAGEREDGKTE